MKNLFDLSGRTALVTGSGSGLGKAIAAGLAAHGARVLVNGRPGSPGVAETVRELKQQDLICEPAEFDVTDAESRAEVIQSLQHRHGVIDILVNNVGLRDRRPVFEFGPNDMPRMLDANLTSPFELSRLVASAMAEHKWGRIINISSVVAQLSGVGDVTYTTAKGGLESMTRALAAEYGELGITVNNISPGFFATEPNKLMLEDESLREWLKHRTSLGRWGDPGEIAGAAIFLASDAAAYVTGQTISVDGGMMGHL